MDQGGDRSPGHAVSKPLAPGSGAPQSSSAEEESSGTHLRNATAPLAVHDRTPSHGTDGIAPVAPAQAHVATGAIPVAGVMSPSAGIRSPRVQPLEMRSRCKPYALLDGRRVQAHGTKGDTS